jgi:hypothetical protein
VLLAVAREAGPELPQEHQNSGSPRHWLIIGSFLVEGRGRTESTVTGDRSHHWHPASRDDQPRAGSIDSSEPVGHRGQDASGSKQG